MDLTIVIIISSVFLFALLFIFLRKKKTIEVTTAEPQGLSDWLTKTRETLSQGFDKLLLSTKQIDSSFIEGLEELLYTSDLGPQTVEKLTQLVREKLSRGELSDLETVKSAIRQEISVILQGAKERNPQNKKPWVILVVGVNGVGKTTSIGKLAYHYGSKGNKVLVVAADTFRAAAQEQLGVWGERAQVDVYQNSNTKDPAAVAYEGVQKGLASNTDVIIVDTAGRLHNKEHLIEELKKVKRVMTKALDGAPHEVLLVVDANTGQNARLQAKQFNDALGVTGLIVTKLDGTARGGVIVGIADETQVGAQYVGVGEKISDLHIFNTSEYVNNLF